MPQAGWCDVCSANTWLDAEGACAHGHDASHISKVYETDPKTDPLKQVGEVLKRAANEAGDAMEQVGTVVQEAWREAEPSAKEAAGSAAGRAQRVGRIGPRGASRGDHPGGHPWEASVGKRVASHGKGMVLCESAERRSGYCGVEQSGSSSGS